MNNNSTLNPAIMKKVYIRPSLMTMTINVEHLVCASLGSAETPRGYYDDAEAVNNGFADVKQQSYNVWDDD